MQISVKKIRPKANKLLSFSSNWKRSHRELNILLGQQIQNLQEKESFPKSIELFFEIPTFKRILKNLSSGSLWKDVYVFTDEDHHPPKEIQQVQNVSLAFQKICGLSHYPNYPKNSCSKVKLLIQNTHDYLFSVYMLINIPGKASKNIRIHLFRKIEEFIQLLNNECSKNKRLFALIYELNLIEDLSIIKLNQISKKDFDCIYKIQSILNICEKKVKDPLFTTHKILNQMHKELNYIFDSFTKNAPFYLPYALKKAIYIKINPCSDGLSIYNALEELFTEKRYEIIETKQKNHHQSIINSCTPIHILEASLEEISTRKSLPSQYRKYFQCFYHQVKDLLKEIDNQNSQVGYFLSGFFETQVSYLLELLNNPKEQITATDIGSIKNDIASFLQKYAKIKPELQQIDIKKILLDPRLKKLELDESKEFIKNTLRLILPERDQDIFLSLEKESRKILMNLLSIYKQINPDTFLATLLKEKIKNFYLLDIPSFSLGWSIFGEISSILYIISSFNNVISKNTIDQFLNELQESPIFLILLKTKKSLSLQQSTTEKNHLENIFFYGQIDRNTIYSISIR